MVGLVRPEGAREREEVEGVLENTLGFFLVPMQGMSDDPVVERSGGSREESAGGKKKKYKKIVKEVGQERGKEIQVGGGG